MTGDRPSLFSLRFKLTAGILLAVLISMTVLSLLLLTAIRDQAVGDLLDRAQSHARSLERALSRATPPAPNRPAHLEPAQLQRLLGGILDRQHVLGLAVYDSQGHEIARQGEPFSVPAGGWTLPAAGPSWRPAAEAADRVLVRAEIPGPPFALRLVMFLSFGPTERLITASQLKAVFQVSAMSLLLFVFTALVLHLTVIRPLAIIRRGMERITSGDLDHRLVVPSRDELGFLAGSFNDMAATLQANRRTIEAQVEALRAAHREALETRSKLIAAEKLASLGTLAAGMAHEVGNPLQSVIGYINLLRQGAVPPAEQGECLSRAAADLQRIHQIMLEMLDYARPAPEPSVSLDVNEIVREVLDGLRREGLLRHLDVRLDLAAGLPRPTGSSHKLQRVFINLVENAVWATEPAGTLLIATRLAEPAGGARHVELTFTDDGRGVSAGDRERVFDPFFTTRLAQGGTGLGLAISRRIVEEMGGRIGVEDAPEKGTRFAIRLPV